jgi:ABC-type uncharacterized transport system permease subunit
MSEYVLSKKQLQLSEKLPALVKKGKALFSLLTLSVIIGRLFFQPEGKKRQ